MHAFIVGGTGQTGRIIISNLLAQGHTVTALVRDPQKVDPQPNLHLEKGTPESEQDLQRCFSHQLPDVVFGTLTSAKTSTGQGLLTEAMTNVVRVMEANGTRRIVYMSAWGVDDSYDSMSCLLKLMVRNTKLLKEFADHKGAEQAIRGAEGVEWTIVRPAILSNKPAAEVIDEGDRGEKMASYMPGISRASVAKFMVDSVGEKEWNHRTPVIHS